MKSTIACMKLGRLNESNDESFLLNAAAVLRRGDRIAQHFFEKTCLLYMTRPLMNRAAWRYDGGYDVALSFRPYERCCEMRPSIRQKR